ncbi:MAG: hypothetical protein KBG15_17420 [Kofleriaceae bacterium]|nr:hypothetical protein [Kofleriaceae bacterium]
MSWTTSVAVVASLGAQLMSLGCSSSPIAQSRPAATTPGHKIDDVSVAEAPVAEPEVTPETYCADVARLMDEKCEALNIAPEDQDKALCVEGVRRALYDRTDDAAEVANTFGRCMRHHCDAAVACIAQARAGWERPAQRRRSCEDADTSGAVALDAKQWAARTGAQAKRYSDVITTAARPIEVCELEGQLGWLMAMRCDDDSQPFHSMAEAHIARVRNIGAAGRCNSIVDLYQVTCPEKAYDVYMDLYMCPAQ